MVLVFLWQKHQNEVSICSSYWKPYFIATSSEMRPTLSGLAVSKRVCMHCGCICVERSCGMRLTFSESYETASQNRQLVRSLNFSGAQKHLDGGEQ